MAPVQAVFRDLCTLEVPPDGMRFQAGSVRPAPIRGRQTESGIRVRLTADLDGARISLQVDVGFGDVVTPRVVETEFPTILDFRAPRLQTHPPEAVVAEKFAAMERLGMANTCMKDFYDLWVMALSFVFGLFGDGHHADALAPEHGIEGDGVLALAGKPRKLLDEDFLQGTLGLAASSSILRNSRRSATRPLSASSNYSPTTM